MGSRYNLSIMAPTLSPKIEVRNSSIRDSNSDGETKGLFAKESFKKNVRFQVVTGEHSWTIMTDEEFQEYIKIVDAYD